MLVTIGLLSACSYRPEPVITERNYEADSTTAVVKLGIDDYKVISFWETLDSAKQRLLKEIADNCPNYQMLAEGTSTKDQVGSGQQLNTFTGKWELAPVTTTGYYYWVRYRCPHVQQAAASHSGLPFSVEEYRQKAFQALAQKCGNEYAIGMEGAENRQGARLQAEGFSLQEQAATAARLLTGAPMDQRTQLYLTALQISTEGERQVREEYLRLMKITPESASQAHGVMYDT